MAEHRLRDEQGVTLLELMIAMALFALVLGAAAQSLVSYHSVMQLQEQRNAAAQNCKALLGQLRNDRDNDPGPFPDRVTDDFPNNWSTTDAAFCTLPDETLTVTYTNANANPLEVIVTSTWTPLRGGQAQFQLSTILTDQ